LLKFYRRRKAALTGTLDTHDKRKNIEISAGEFFFSSVVTVVLFVFLFSSFHYSAAVRLFPSIVSMAGLALVTYWLSLIIRYKRIQQITRNTVSAASGVPMILCLGLLVTYALLVPVAGFINSSVVFFLLVILASRHTVADRPWKFIVLPAMTIAVCLFALS